ncbi:MAG: AI-2E family transporter, partial [Acutalibacteraceae bacterium]
NLTRQANKIVRALFKPDNAKKLIDFTAMTNDIFTKFVTGQLTEACIIGSLCFIGMLIFGMPYAGIISVLIGFTALIPIFGAFIGTGIGAFLILLENPLKAFWFVVFIIVLQQLEGNLIYPRVVGKSVGLPGIWVLTAVTIGGGLFGVLGMLFSVPVCSVLYVLFRKFVNKRVKDENTQIEIKEQIEEKTE